MKKKVIIGCLLTVIFLFVSTAVLYIVNSPEYALLKMAGEIKTSGFEAIEKNLTEDAYNKLQPIREFMNNNFVRSIISLFSKEDYASILMEKANEVDWTVDEIVKSRTKATVTIGFNYKDEFVGTVDLELCKEKNKWKINDLYDFNIE